MAKAGRRVLVHEMQGEVENRFGGDFQGLENWSALMGLEMVNPIPHGGAGNFHIPVRAVTGMHPVVGEEASFQDFMGFGMRYALSPGCWRRAACWKARAMTCFGGGSWSRRCGIPWSIG